MLPSTFRLLMAELAVGRTIDVTCKAGVEDLECYPEANMRLTIVSAASDNGEGEDEVLRMKVSYKKFDEFNKAFESANYYGIDRMPTKTAREVDMYEIEETIFVMADFNPNDVFMELEPISDLFYQKYLREKQNDETYVQFLERLVAVNYNPM